jgi:hypothetical protein
MSRRVEFAGRYSVAKTGIGLPAAACVTMLPTMFVVTEADAAAIRAIFEKEGEMSAAIEVRRLVPGVTDNAKARECARTIAGVKTAAAPAACQITPVRLRRRRAREPVHGQEDRVSAKLIVAARCLFPPHEPGFSPPELNSPGRSGGRRRGLC